jgi:hypothetical protein
MVYRGNRLMPRQISHSTNAPAISNGKAWGIIWISITPHHASVQDGESSMQGIALPALHDRRGLVGDEAV